MSRNTLLGKTELELASLQTEQVGNACSFHAISAATQLLVNRTFDPQHLSQVVNQRWWRGQFMRIAPNWAVTPRMQKRIVHFLAKKYHLPVVAKYQSSEPNALLGHLLNPKHDAIPIITLTWLWHQAPPIYYGDSKHNMNKTRRAGGHTMVLAAYDSTHRAGGQLLTPWGFINSWRSNVDALFWMTDADFRKAWRFWLPGVGPNPVVFISRADHSAYSDFFG